MPPAFLQLGECGGPFRCNQAGLEGPGSLERNRLGPGILDKCCLHVCYDCLGLIALFRDAIMFVHDWATLSTFIMTEIRDWRTITWELCCLGSIHPTCDVARFFCRNVWQIKDLEAVVTPGGADDIRFLLSAGLWGCHCPGDASDPGDWTVGLCGRAAEML